MLARLDVEYAAIVPGSSFRGLHDSLVNYLGNQQPGIILCNHEEIAVAVAHVERACPLLEESITPARAVKDRRVLSMALRHLSLVVLSMGDQLRAGQLIEEALTVSREEGYKREIACNLIVLGQTLGNAGHWETVEPLLLESIAVGRQSGDVTPILVATGALARLYLKRGDLARARQSVHEALALARQVDLKSRMAYQLVMLGDLASAEQDWETADDWYRQALRAASLVTACGVIARALRHYAAMCAVRGDARGAVRIFGATSSVHDFPSRCSYFRVQKTRSSQACGRRSEKKNFTLPGPKASQRRSSR